MFSIRSAIRTFLLGDRKQEQPFKLKLRKDLPFHLRVSEYFNGYTLCVSE